jgi:hypothetical protein
MRTLLSFAATGLVLLASGSAAQAQYFHGHVHYHRGHYHLHGHWHYPNYSSYSGYPVIYGSSGYAPAYSYPSVVASPPVIVYSNPMVSPTGVVPASGTSLKPNALPPYAGPGVTLRLPADYSGPVYLRIDNRDIELKPGTEVTMKDKPACLVEFDRGGDFGATRQELSEGSYKMTVGPKGWHVLPDPTPVSGGLRPNTLPGEPKK